MCNKIVRVIVGSLLFLLHFCNEIKQSSAQQFDDVRPSWETDLGKAVFTISVPSYYRYYRSLPQNFKISSDFKLQEICIAVGSMKKMVIEIWEQLRGRMKDGMTQWGIPRLEPFSIPVFPFHLNHGYYYKIKGRLRNILIHNLSSWKMSKLDTNLPNKADFNLTLFLPSITVTGDYDLDGVILNVIPIMGKGPFKTKYGNVTQILCIELDVDKSKNGRIQVANLDLRMSIGKVQVHFEGLGGNQLSSGVANSVLNMFGTALFKELEPLFRKEVNQVLKQQLNLGMKNVKLPEILWDSRKVICSDK